MRNMTLELKVSEYSIRKVVNNDLGIRFCKRKKVHFLNEQVKKKRVFRCKGELGWHASRSLDNVLFSNEKRFTIYEVCNSQNDRIISSMTRVNKEVMKYVPRIQTHYGISVHGRTPLFLSPVGLKSTLPIITS